MLGEGLLFMSFMVLGRRRLFRLLQVLQQDAYLPRRYLGWLWRHRAFDKRVTVSLVAIQLVYPSSFVCAIVVALLCCFERDPRKDAKLPLSMTKRSAELHWVALTLVALASVVVIAMGGAFRLLALVVVLQLMPLLLLAAQGLLYPLEKRRQRRFISEAKSILRRSKPFVVGITGSYGKTSTKDALGRLLRLAVGSTFWPEKGINTEMGITRAIREGLASWNDYAVIEMAAYGKGSIRRLCDLTPPQAGIITSIGTAHLERFGSIETIRRTKAELADALPPGAPLVCNGDDPRVRQIVEEHPSLATCLYGSEGEGLRCRLLERKTVDDGRSLYTRYRILWEDTEYCGTTPLLGKPAISNLMAAFSMALLLGADPDLLIAGLACMPAVDNRLQVERRGDLTILHDAYNSNPTGFMSALEVLGNVQAKRRILVTPGMVELGEERAAAHQRIAEEAATVCDEVFLIGETNRSVLLASFRDLDFPREKVRLFASRDEALKAVLQQKESGDAVLIENDLPDIYEQPLRL